MKTSDPRHQPREEGDGMFLTAVIMIIIVVALIIPDFRKSVSWGVSEVWNQTFNLPVLTVNPHGQVVKIEANGKIYTRDSHRENFDELVKKFKAGRYETDHTGRLDGRP